MVERRPYKANVGGSNPSTSTKINMKKFQQGDRVKLTIKDPKVRGQEGIVKSTRANKSQVVLELWCRWGTFTNYYPLWIDNSQLEKVTV